MDATRNSTGGAIAYFLAILCLVVALILSAVFGLQALVHPSNPAGNAVVQSEHAVIKHGFSAVDVRQCLDKKGALQIWVNPETGRRANLCKLDNQTFGLQIVQQRDGIWREVTSFIKDKMTRIDQVMQYLRNCGYRPLE